MAVPELGNSADSRLSTTPNPTSPSPPPASPPTTNSGSDSIDPSLSKLFASLSVGQVWGVLGACAAVVIASFALGGVLQSGRDDATVAARDQKIITLGSDIATRDQTIGSLNTRINDQSRAIGELTKNLNGALNEKDIYAQKAELLDKYLSYTQNRSDIAKTLLVNVVCLLWKESERSRISIRHDRPNITGEQIRTGLAPGMEALLTANGVPPDVIARIRMPESFVQSQQTTSPVTVGPFTVFRQSQVFPGQRPEDIRQDATAQAEKYLSGVRIIKIITFPDGSQYQMPDEIALAVHTKPECAPN